MDVSIFTLGCKVNSYDGQAMADSFVSSGYNIVDFNEKPDIYIINTCCVTALSEKKSRQMIRRSKRANPESIIVVVGCYPQADKEALLKLKEIDIIAGTDDKVDIVDIVENYINKNITFDEVTDIMKSKMYKETKIENFNEKTRAIIKIQDGCNRFCSYCIIPYTRGPNRSREFDNIIKEITLIAKKGFKEVVLTGIHLSSYGKDMLDINLLDIIKATSEIEGIERIRLGSLEPTLITEDFISGLKKISKLCNHFHLSLQSGCDETLKRMNRKYTTEEYFRAVQLIKENLDEPSITTDIMTGFPGETEKEFEETVAFVERIKFSKIHVFRFSPRKGTKAFDMGNQVEQKIKDIRSNILMDLSDKFADEFNRKYIGETVEVLFEQESEDKEFIQGHTKNYILVKVKSRKMFKNQIFRVKINQVKKEHLLGDLVK